MTEDLVDDSSDEIKIHGKRNHTKQNKLYIKEIEIIERNRRK